MDLILHRLANQQISATQYANPLALVAHMGAVQGQDYAACKWALGLRLRDTTEAAVEDAINDGTLIRTHVLRPTWHLVAPKDIRWMLELTAPRVNQFNSSQYRQLGLDDAIFMQSNKVIVKCLTANRYMTRAAIETELQKKSIATNDIRLTCIMMYAELAGLICNGPRQGKQFTYALMDERVPPTHKMTKDEALAELALRYFNSHGPATLQDFVWWSGLTVADAKKGVDSVRTFFINEAINGITYLLPNGTPVASGSKNKVYLLPAFDEYTVAYKDRSTLLPVAQKNVTAMEMLNPVIVINGLVCGTWRRTIKKQSIEIELKPFSPLNKQTLKAIGQAAEAYGSFYGLDVNIIS